MHILTNHKPNERLQTMDRTLTNGIKVFNELLETEEKLLYTYDEAKKGKLKARLIELNTIWQGWFKC